MSYITIKELKRNLYALFCQHGPILELVCVKALKMKGQAFIVYHHLESADLAIKHLNGWDFYDKPMVGLCSISLCCANLI